MPWGRGEHRSNERRRPALRKTGHEEGVFHEESELQKQGEDGLVLVWAALCCGPQITKGDWSQAAGTCRWSQARTWAPLVVLGRSGRSLWPPERPWPLWRRPFACRPLLSGGLSLVHMHEKVLAKLRRPVRCSPCQSIQSRVGGLGPRDSPRLTERGSWSCLPLPHLTQRAVDPAERRWAEWLVWLLLLWQQQPLAPCDLLLLF